MGCGAQFVRYTEEGGNPPFPRAECTYPRDGFQSARESGVFRIPFDREGAIYPNPSTLAIDDRELEAAGSSLRVYFSGRRGYDPDAVAEDYSRAINAYCGKDTALVVLVHGMDNSYPEARRSYDLARRVIRDERRGQKLAFLEVYWDGLHGSPLTVWPEARRNSKWVGLGLRRLLAKIHREIPLRILTHSRGSSVVSAAFWNVPLGEDQDSNGRFEEVRKSLPTPTFDSIRFGLLAPAMPEGDFDSFFERNPGRTGEATDEKVILGVNEDDPALSKGFMGPDFWGSTAAGCRRERFLRSIAPKLNRRREIASMVDLSASEVHDFKDYLLRKRFLDEFLPRLFEVRPASGLLGTGEQGLAAPEETAEASH